MRAQASIADDGLGDHRHVDDDAVAFLDAEILEHRRERWRLRPATGIGEVRFVPVTGLS